MQINKTGTTGGTTDGMMSTDHLVADTKCRSLAQPEGPRPAKVDARGGSPITLRQLAEGGDWQLQQQRLGQLVSGWWGARLAGKWAGPGRQLAGRLGGGTSKLFILLRNE